MEHVFQAPHNKKCNRKRGHKIDYEHAAATSARRPISLCHFIPSHPSKFLRTPYPDVGNCTRPLQASGLADEAISEVHRAVAEGGQRSGDSVLNLLRHLGMRSVGTRGHNVIKVIRAIKRLFIELPQPARTLERCFIGFFLGSLLLLVITRVNWFALGMSVSGVFVSLFGLHVFRDLNGTASTWSKIYKESHGISPNGFTFADVPTIKSMGFMYMIMGVFFVAMGIVLSVS